jgi:GNAT superfamily N-acetyltransferase
MARDLIVERFETLSEIEGLRVSGGFSAIVPTAEVLDMFRKSVAIGGTVTAALLRGALVGYAADLPFAPVEWNGQRIARRWEAIPQVRELGAVEVAAPFRNQGIARKLMQAFAEGDRLERYIVIGEALCWHWDVAGAGNDPWEYRRRLCRLLESAGFQRFDTDAPDVTYHAANFLAARIGGATAPSSRRAFEEALFQTAA